MAITLGIDIGGTGIKGALVDIKRGVFVSDRIRYETPSPAKPKDCAKVVKKLINDLDWEGRPVGCGFPAILKNNICLSASNIDEDFIGLNISKYFQKYSKSKFTVLNDADAAALAEVKFGAGFNHKGTVLVITLGTGIGSGLVRAGKLIPNTELGHLIFKNQKAELYTSNKTRVTEELTFEVWGKRLNKFLNHLEFLFSPDLIILGGGVSKKFDQYSDFIKLRRTIVVPAKLKNHAGIIGAALNVYN